MAQALRRAVLATCAISLVACAGEEAPGPTLITLSEGCGECRIEVSQLVALGDEGEAYLGYPQSMARNSHGQYLVASRARPEEILVFTADGKFAGTIGREGRGPAEFSWIAWIALIGDDTLHVIDLQQHRWTVLSPTLEVLRTAYYPGGFNHNAVPLGNGNMVISSYLATSSLPGSQMHLTGPEGQVLRSFGGETQDPAPLSLPSTWARVIAAASDTTVWTAPINRYRVDLWHLNGRQITGFVRQPQPFEPWLEVRPPSAEEPPQPKIKALRQDAAGHLWVLYHVPDPLWRNGLQTVRNPEGRAVTGDDNALRDTIVEVIDPVRGHVLASYRIDDALHGFVADGIAYSFDEDNVRIKVWEVRLVAP